MEIYRIPGSQLQRIDPVNRPEWLILAAGTGVIAGSIQVPGVMAPLRGGRGADHQQYNTRA
jgi:hypothetical protein